MIISTTGLKTVENTIYHSHLKWQIATFWIGLVAYGIAFFIWQKFGLSWPIVAAFLFVAYRVLTNIKSWTTEEPLNRVM